VYLAGRTANISKLITISYSLVSMESQTIAPHSFRVQCFSSSDLLLLENDFWQDSSHLCAIVQMVKHLSPMHKHPNSHIQMSQLPHTNVPIPAYKLPLHIITNVQHTNAPCANIYILTSTYKPPAIGQCKCSSTAGVPLL